MIRDMLGIFTAWKILEDEKILDAILLHPEQTGDFSFGRVCLFVFQNP